MRINIFQFFIGVIVVAILGAAHPASGAEAFVHPGMLQNQQDLAFVKQAITKGQEPWKTAWRHLCAENNSSLNFEPKPFVHVIRGSYAHPNIGGQELEDSAHAAYSQALQWVVTGDQQHAQKAIAIINAWSYTLWDFQGNDAKLLAAWSGHVFCNAAEILRRPNSGWQEKDVDQFKRMLLTVYYPLLKNYFPEANGNWDAAMMDTMLCIGIFCDDHTIFDSAVKHFLRGEGNGGITKYIYPSGQCEENARDQAHTQLGLGELAQACQVAYNQGVDLYGTADNRLALGFEYTAKYMLGETVPAYGILSPRARGKFSDIYEGIYQHYHFVKGLEMPFTKRVSEQLAGKSWGVLTLSRSGLIKPSDPQSLSPRGHSVAEAGAQDDVMTSPPADAVRITLGESIQKALDKLTHGGWVVLTNGTYVLSAPLRIPSNVTLVGQGSETILTLESNDTVRATLVNGSDDLHGVTLRNFVVEGSTVVRASLTDPNQDRRQRASQMAPSRGGIIFSAQHEGQMHNLNFEHVTVRNCTQNGVAILGAKDVNIAACDFSDNGASVAPGAGLQHDLLLAHVVNASVRDSRFDDSLWGSGIHLSGSRDVNLLNNEAARNAINGLDITESKNIHIQGNLTEGNDQNGILMDGLMDGCQNIEVVDNLSRNNGGSGILADRAVLSSIHDNFERDNGRQ
ncbi:MAG TPA: alginate lyase family protein [Verrucomicrobiae bacterium]